MTADDLVCCRLPGCAARLVRCVVVAESSRADVNLCLELVLRSRAVWPIGCGPCWSSSMPFVVAVGELAVCSRRLSSSVSPCLLAGC